DIVGIHQDRCENPICTRRNVNSATEVAAEERRCGNSEIDRCLVLVPIVSFGTKPTNIECAVEDTKPPARRATRDDDFPAFTAGSAVLVPEENAATTIARD